VQEGLFLYNHGLSPYDGGVFHQAPLLLPLFSLLPDPSRYPLVTVLLYTLVDLASAYALMQIFASGQSYSTRFFTSSRESKRWSSSAVAAAYLFNPFVILTCLARSTNVFGNLFILIATLKACRGALMGSAFALAIASYMSLHPLMLLPPLTILCYDSWVLRRSNTDQNASTTSLVSFAVRYTFVLVAAIAILFALSYALIGYWSFISAVYASRLLLPDLTPNVGLWWYFFIEIFDSFRNFFLGVFWLHMISYSPALTIRLREQPLAAVVLLCGIFAIFQPYANVGDAGFWLSLLSMYGHVHEREYSLPLPDHIYSTQPTDVVNTTVSRYAFPAISALIYTTLLGPAFYYLWVYAGSGNANFFYAITLVWSLALSVILADMVYAIIRDEWEKERPEMKGKEARQI
jgi:phosphatidylinositol glycan class U